MLHFLRAAHGFSRLPPDMPGTGLGTHLPPKTSTLTLEVPRLSYAHVVQRHHKLVEGILQCIRLYVKVLHCGIYWDAESGLFMGNGLMGGTNKKRRSNHRSGQAPHFTDLTQRTLSSNSIPTTQQ
ncbi:hypothetical protein BDC45DRAFT_574163 [Circinella umbellata]|nr:hypothetical protein BDC45DRAFT_574163 [Circinella umbellata]